MTKNTKEDKTIVNMKANAGMLQGKPSLSMIGLLIVQMIIGYEWLLSGIAKIAAGDFVSGLAVDLTEVAANSGGWYAGFLNSAVIPNAMAFGYLIEAAEVLAGIALIVGPLLWIFAWDRIPEGLRRTTLILMIAAGVGGIFMALNFHLANGGNHPWVIPDSAFDEGVDLDLLLSTIQIVITTVQAICLIRLRRESTEMVSAVSSIAQPKHI